jgi:hypothetical protein
MNWKFCVAMCASLGYLVLVLLCLIQWGTPHPWARLDFFADGYLGMKLVNTFHSVWSGRTVFRSKPVLREWWALDSDPKRADIA